MRKFVRATIEANEKDGNGQDVRERVDANYWKVSVWFDDEPVAVRNALERKMKAVA